MNIHEMNTVICEALGIDTTGAHRVEITLTTDDVPRVHVYRIVTSLSSQVERLELLRTLEVAER